jgi:hypothetical protein
MRPGHVCVNALAHRELGNNLQSHLCDDAACPEGLNSRVKVRVFA